MRDICIVTKTIAKPIQHTSAETSWKNALSDISEYITEIVTSVSIVCLFVIVMTHVATKALHTMPNNITVALCITLLIADTLFLSTEELRAYDTVCRIIAVALHWLFLCTYVWCMIVMFEMVVMFTTESLKYSSSKKRFMYYCLFTAIIPTVIVAITVTLDERDITELFLQLNFSVQRLKDKTKTVRTF